MVLLAYLYLLATNRALYRLLLPYTPIYWVTIQYLYPRIVYPITYLVLDTRLYSMQCYYLVLDTRLHPIGYYRGIIVMIMCSLHSYIITTQLYAILCIGGRCELWRFYEDCVKPIDKQMFALAQ